MVSFGEGIVRLFFITSFLYLIYLSLKALAIFFGLQSSCRLFIYFCFKKLFFAILFFPNSFMLIRVGPRIGVGIRFIGLREDVGVLFIGFGTSVGVHCAGSGVGKDILLSMLSNCFSDIH